MAAYILPTLQRVIAAFDGESEAIIGTRLQSLPPGSIDTLLSLDAIEPQPGAGLERSFRLSTAGWELVHYLAETVPVEVHLPDPEGLRRWYLRVAASSMEPSEYEDAASDSDMPNAMPSVVAHVCHSAGGGSDVPAAFALRSRFDVSIEHVVGTRLVIEGLPMRSAAYLEFEHSGRAISLRTNLGDDWTIQDLETGESRRGSEPLRLPVEPGTQLNAVVERILVHPVKDLAAHGPSIARSRR